MSYKKANGKKFIGIFICAVAILIATCIAVPFFSKEEGYRMITVFEVSGTVGVVKDGIEYEAYPGMHLQEGHVIVTSEDSYARLVLDDDKYVKVEAGSRLEFETLGLLGTNKTRLKLDRGAITTEIVNPLGADEEYVVNTPNAVLAVRGTFFRVDLRVTKNGEIDTNVYTYGGKVASNRVMPTGEMVEEEVIVDAGFMTAIRMDALETIYIVGMAESPTGEPVEETKKNTVPIEPAVIPDDDLVDMYFASENGHEMFLSTDEIKENIEEREISVEEQVPVYEKADEVKAQSQEESDTDNTTSTALIPDDRGDWEEDTEVAVEETDEPQQEVVEDVPIEEDVVVEAEDEVVPEEVVQETPEQVVVAPVVPPTVTVEPETEVPHTHDYVSQITTPATCTDVGLKTYTCTCGDSYTEEITALGHSETTEYIDGTASADGLRRVYCENCDETYEEETLFSIPLHFPDEAFAQYVRNTYNNDSYTNSLSEEEFASLEAATNVTLQGTVDQDGGVASLEGIEYFTSMKNLRCGYNAGITELDVSNCTKLTYINAIGASGLQSVSLNGCTELQSLYLGDTAVTELNLASNTNLTRLEVENTGITQLNLAPNTKLMTLNVENTGITQLDLATNTKMETLKLTNAPLEKLIIYSNSMYNLDLSTQGTTLTYLDIKYGSGLGRLDLTANTELTYLAGNTLSDITSLDLTKNTKLKTVEIRAANQLTSFNVSGNSSIETLTISETGLTSANFDGCTGLKSLTVGFAPITSLSLTGCDNLEYFGMPGLDLFTVLPAIPIPEKIQTLNLNYCDGFTSLDVTAYTQLSKLYVNDCWNLSEINTGGRYTGYDGVLRIEYENTATGLTIN